MFHNETIEEAIKFIRFEHKDTSIPPHNFEYVVASVWIESPVNLFKITKLDLALEEAVSKKIKTIHGAKAVDGAVSFYGNDCRIHAELYFLVPSSCEYKQYGIKRRGEL